MTSFSPDGLPHFPVMMHLTEIGNFKSIEKDLIRCAYDYRKKDPKGRVISNEGGWQSSLLHKENNIIRSTLLASIGEYFESNNIFDIISESTNKNPLESTARGLSIIKVIFIFLFLLNIIRLS